MHFTQREQAALREAGLDQDTIEAASEAVVEATKEAADDIRGYVRFDTWGVPVEGGRVLTDAKVELTLGPTVDGRVRFASDEDAL